MKVFLGGTVNKSTWRNVLIPKLEINYYNPVVEEWTEEIQKIEIQERENCDFCLYVITPRMTGYYSIAEVIDDSFKRPDRTLYCYLIQDDEFKFNETQLEDLEKVKKIVIQNGGHFLKSLDDIAQFLNSANSRDKSILAEDLKDVFISYGRRHSLDFARKLYEKLTAEGKKVWFDMNNIPLGVDFQEQIDAGIQKADNFIYIMSPHAVKSEYCLKEVILALKYNKRIIPILHIEPSDCWDKIHPEIGRRNWIYMRQQADDAVTRSEWKEIDNFENAFKGLLWLINLHKDYVKNHTILLNQAINWQKRQELTTYLLTNNERKNAEKWLIRDDFKNEKNEITQAPCLPTDLHAEYISESKKCANNLQTDTFISYTNDNIKTKEKIYKALIRKGIIVWLHSKDIDKGEDFEQEVKKGIEQTDNFVYIISNEAVNSIYCKAELDYAVSLNKSIIPILIEKIDINALPETVKRLQFIDFSECINIPEPTEVVKNKILTVEERVKQDVDLRRNKTPFDEKVDELLFEINDDSDYFYKHKSFLVQAIRWNSQNRSNSFLLHGFNLENAKTWLKIGMQKKHKPTNLHLQFIEESNIQAATIIPEIFISYSQADGDFVNKLNIELQTAGKSTWLEQDNITQSPETQKEILKGIEKSSNFLFIVSPNSIVAPNCKVELEYANKLNKRIITILIEKTEASTIPESISKIQWIDFESKKFNISFQELIRTLDVDREYVERHTKYSQLATEWKNKNHELDLLLRGNEFAIAEEWYKDAQKTKKQPSPTPLHTYYLEESRVAISKAQDSKKRAQILMRILLLIATVGIVVSFILILNTRRSMQAIKEKELKLKALYLASTAKDVMENESVKALQLAYNAYLINNDNADIHPFIIKAITDVFNNFISGKRAFYKDEIELSNGLFWANYTKDGSKIFAYSEDSIKILSLENNVISQFAANIWDAEISPDGNDIVVYNENDIKFYDINGKMLKDIEDTTKNIDKIFVDDDKFITFSWTNNVDIYNYKGEILNQIKLGDSLLLDVVYNDKTDNFITISDYKKLIVWNTAGDTVSSIDNYNTPLIYNNLSDAQILNISSKNVVQIYDFNGKLTNSFKINFTPIFTKISPDGKLIILQKSDNTIFAYQNTGKKILQKEFELGINDVKFNKTTTDILLLCDDIKFYSLTLATQKMQTFTGHTDKLSFIDFLPNEKLIISYSWDKTAKIWDLQGGLQMSLEGTSEVASYSLSNNGQLLTYYQDGTAKIWDISTIQEPKFSGHTENIYSIATSADQNIMATFSEDNSIKIWDSFGKLLQTYPFDYLNYTIVFSPNNNKYAIYNDIKALIYNINGKLLNTINFSKYEPTDLIFSNNGNSFVTKNYDNTIYYWNCNGTIVSKIKKLKGSINKIVFSNKNDFFVLSDNNIITKYDTLGNILGTYQKENNEFYDIFFKKAGLQILSSESNSNNMNITAFNGICIAKIKGIKGNILFSEFAENGDIFYIETNENYLYFINNEGEILSSFFENTTDILEIHISNDGTRAIILYFNKKYKILDIVNETLLSDETEMINDAIFGNNDLIYMAKENQIKIYYPFDLAIDWLKNNELPELSDKDKEKYGIIKNTENDN